MYIKMQAALQVWGYMNTLELRSRQKHRVRVDVICEAEVRSKSIPYMIETAIKIIQIHFYWSNASLADMLHAVELHMQAWWRLVMLCYQSMLRVCEITMVWYTSELEKFMDKSKKPQTTRTAFWRPWHLFAYIESHHPFEIKPQVCIRTTGQIQ